MEGIIEQHLLNLPTLLLGPSPIDWCEPNHPLTNPLGVQEFHNTWTNAAYVLVGLLLFRLFLSSSSSSSSSSSPSSTLAPSPDPLLLAYALSVILTGITSGIFHATLLYYTQKSDEFFENLAILSLAYHHLLPHGKSLPSTRYFLYACHVSFLLIVVLFIPSVFCSVHLALCILFCFRSVFLRVNALADPGARLSISRTFLVALACTILGFGAWIVDFVSSVALTRRLKLRRGEEKTGSTMMISHHESQATSSCFVLLFACDARCACSANCEKLTSLQTLPKVQRRSRSASFLSAS